VIVDRRKASDEQIRWYLDGHQFFRVNESQVGKTAWTAAVDHGYSILLNVSIGGHSRTSNVSLRNSGSATAWKQCCNPPSPTVVEPVKPPPA
jgi:hypothetical protein